MKNACKSLVILFFLFVAVKSVAQRDPVSVSMQITPPYSVYLADYVSPETEPFKLNLVLLDLSQPVYDVRLQLVIEGTGVHIETNPSYVPAAITLESGSPLQLSGNALWDYFRPENLLFSGFTRQQYEKSGGALPEGFYRFTVRVLDYRRPDIVLSRDASYMAWLVQAEPPLLNTPYCGSEVKLAEGQQTVVFQWTSLNNSPNSALSTEYIFTLVEIRPEGLNPNDALNSLRPLYQEQTAQTSLIYGPTQPPLTPGMEYAWRVQAVDVNGRDLYKNQGFSNTCSFRIPEEEIVLGAPENIRATGESARRGRVTWNMMEGADGYTVEYKKVQNYPASQIYKWFSLEDTDGDAVINNLEPETEYEVRVGSKRGRYVSTWSDPVRFRTQSMQEYACGQDIEPVAATNHSPLATAMVGDIVKVGLFEMRILKVTGGDGVFTGIGTVYVPFMHTNINVYFENIGINENMELVSGTVNGISEGMEGLMDRWKDTDTGDQGDTDVEDNDDGSNAPDNGDAADDFSGTDISYDGDIDSVYTTDDGAIVIVDADGSTTEQQPEDGEDTRITDENGDSWVVDNNGNVESGGNTGAGSTNGISSFDLQQTLITEVLDEFKKDIDIWLDNYGKGPLDDWIIERMQQLPSCLPEDEDELTYYREEAIPEAENNISDFVSIMLDNTADKTVLEDLVKGLNNTNPLKSQMSTDDWQTARETTCKYLIKQFGRLFVTVGDEKYRDGDIAIVKRGYKQTVDISLFSGKNQVTDDVAWSVNKESNSIETVTLDLSYVSKDENGTSIVATWNGRQISINVVIAEVVFPRSVTMAVTANLYPIVEPEGIADEIEFVSGDKEILTLSNEYPILRLDGHKAGEVTITAKVGNVIFHEQQIKVIKEPDLDLVLPTESSVKFENITASSINYSTVIAPEIQGGALNGLCSPERIIVDEPSFFYLKGDRWFPYIKGLKGEYFFDYRLIEGQKEVTGPAGNTSEDNHCAQVMVLGSIPKYNHGPDYQNYYDRQKAAGRPIWYMLDAVKRHEEVHKPNVIDAYLDDLTDSVKLFIEDKLTFQDEPQKSFSEIQDENFVMIDLAVEALDEKLAEYWKRKAIKRSEHDHDPNGPAEQAEYKVINPMISRICDFSKANNWQNCEPDVCSKSIPFGPENIVIVDVTDPSNAVNYDLNGNVNISMGNRDKIRLQFKVQNSMLIDKDVSWKFTFDGGEVIGSSEISFKKDQLKDTPEIVSVVYQYSHFSFNIKQ